MTNDSLAPPLVAVMASARTQTTWWLMYSQALTFIMHMLYLHGSAPGVVLRSP